MSLSHAMVEKGIVINSSQKRRRSSFEIYVSISSQFNADGWCLVIIFSLRQRWDLWLGLKQNEERDRERTLVRHFSPIYNDRKEKGKVHLKWCAVAKWNRHSSQWDKPESDNQCSRHCWWTICIVPLHRHGDSNLGKRHRNQFYEKSEWKFSWTRIKSRENFHSDGLSTFNCRTQFPLTLVIKGRALIAKS